MYDAFTTRDRWTGEQIHCVWVANIVAIATRHADAVDIKFIANDRPVWIALPCEAWARFREKTGHAITDRLAIQLAGHFLKQAIESGFDNGREMYALSVEEVLQHLDAVMEEAKHTDLLPIVPHISGSGNAVPQANAQVHLVPHGTRHG